MELLPGSIVTALHLRRSVLASWNFCFHQIVSPHVERTRGEECEAQRVDLFRVPSLFGPWRTPPYLHDGSAETIRDVLTRRNPNDQHGRTSDLSADDIDALCAYVLSL